MDTMTRSIFSVKPAEQPDVVIKAAHELVIEMPVGACENTRVDSPMFKAYRNFYISVDIFSNGKASARVFVQECGMYSITAQLLINGGSAKKSTDPGSMHWVDGVETADVKEWINGSTNRIVIRAEVSEKPTRFITMATAEPYNPEAGIHVRDALPGMAMYEEPSHKKPKVDEVPRRMLKPIADATVKKGDVIPYRHKKGKEVREMRVISPGISWQEPVEGCGDMIQVCIMLSVIHPIIMCTAFLHTHHRL